VTIEEDNLKNCEKCGLAPDLCACKEEEKEKSMLEKYCPISERERCVICGHICFGLMDFAQHVAQFHGISALQYWNKYGHNGEKQTDETINPSKRKQE
jgi:hypothetical protein